MEIRTVEDVKEYLTQHGDIFQQMVDVLADQIFKIGQKFTEWWKEGREWVVCGNGGSAATMSHLAGEGVGRLRSDDLRPPFMVINLAADSSTITAIANDFGYKEVFARQVQALRWHMERAGAKYVLIGDSTSGTSENVIRAFEEARKLGIPTVGITCGSTDKPVAKLADYVIVVPVNPSVNQTQTTQVANTVIIHVLYEIIAAEWARMEAEDRKVSSVLPDYPPGQIGPVNPPTLSTDRPMTSGICRPPFGSADKPDPERLLAIVDKFPQQPILVAGDVMLDWWRYGESSLSPEAVAIKIRIEKEKFLPGGAANVVNNFKAFGADASLWGVIDSKSHDESSGYISWGFILKTVIEAAGIRWLGETDPGRRTTVKERLESKHSSLGYYQVCRADWETNEPYNIKDHSSLMNGYDVYYVADYDKGVVTPTLMEILRPETQKRGVPLVVDPKPAEGRDHKRLYSNVSTVKPNTKELGELTGSTFRDSDDHAIASVGSRYAASLNSDIVVTRGPFGCTICSISGEVAHIKTLPPKGIPDVAGAGDTFGAWYTSALACGATHCEASHLAVISSWLAIHKQGTATVSQAELIEEIDRRVAKREYPFD